MSNISTIYDRALVVLAALFPSKRRIPYPYVIERNNNQLMSDGYGMIIGPASFEEFETCGFLVARSISIVFTRQLYKLDSATSESDTIIKHLLEDVYTVQKSFYNYNELDISPNIARVDIVGVSEPEEVNADKSSYLSMTAEFNFYVYEKL